MQAILALEDGASFASRLRRSWRMRGEVVFNTSLTGYQEIFTDPPMPPDCRPHNPQIGNYGTNQADNESARPI